MFRPAETIGRYLTLLFNDLLFVALSDVIEEVRQPRSSSGLSASTDKYS